MAAGIIKQAGGADNIVSATHCMTRLRLVLRDRSKFDTDAVKQVPGVLNVIIQNGEYQVVIGQDVPDLYEEVVKIDGIQAGGTAARQHVIRPANSQFDADAGSKFAMQGIGNGQNFHGPPSRPRAQPSGSIPAGTAHNQGGIPQFLPSPSGVLHGLARQQQRQLGSRAVPAAA